MIVSAPPHVRTELFFHLLSDIVVVLYDSPERRWTSQSNSVYGMHVVDGTHPIVCFLVRFIVDRPLTKCTQVLTR